MSLKKTGHNTPLRSTLLIRYTLTWIMLAVVATGNGILRELSYGKYLPELLAHQVSTATAMLFSGLLVWRISRLWPLASSRQAWFVGFSWLIATVLFEFGFGHFVFGHDWSKLVADYNIFNGRLWLLFLTWVTVMPYVFHKPGSTD